MPPPGRPSDATDVVVIGGGPAGSAAATLLADQGWSARLFERERFPREHVGESLLPASLPILDALGVLPAVQEAGFIEKYGATMVWGTDHEPWSWYFRETNREFPHAYQVWRPTFDKLLLDNAREHGVDVREQHRVTDLSMSESGVKLRVASSTGAEFDARARFVVDASGQNGVIARKLNLRRHDDYFQNLGVYAYFEDAAHLEPPDDGNIFIESYPEGWVWMIPLSGGRTSVGAVVDSRAGQAGIQEHGIAEFFQAQLAQAPRASALLAGAHRFDGPHVIRDWSYVAEPLVGDTHILVGDAACFVDPLFSSGVHLALSSALLGAAYVTTALRTPGLAEPAAQVYAELYMQQYRHFRELARLFYASNRSVDSYSWEARKILEDDASTPRDAFIRAVAGQPPQGYERVVLERGDAPPSFAADVRAVERERERRSTWWDQALAVTETRQALYDATPRRGAAVEVVPKPILEEGQFVWGRVLVTSNRREGTPVSSLIERLVELCDGHRPLREILAILNDGREGEESERTLSASMTAFKILFIDGAVDGVDESPGTVR